MVARILVLGGGFAGLSAINHLAKAKARGMPIDVRLIDSQPVHVFAPALPDLISRRIRPEYLQYRLAPHCLRKGVQFTRASVLGIDFDSVKVETDKGEFTGDYVLITTGCITDYYGNQQAPEHSLGLKSIGAARQIHHRVALAAERVRKKEPAGATVVVGGGYTGFEAATHVAWYLQRATRQPYARLREICPTMIVDVANDMLRTCHISVRKWVVARTAEMGVQMRRGVTIEAFEQQGVLLTDGTRIPRANVIWTAGFRPHEFIRTLPAERCHGGRLEVDANLALTGSDRVFAAGDVAAFAPKGSELPLRMSVQFSLTGGKCAADNILRRIADRPLKHYRPIDLGYVVPLGNGRGAGVILGQLAWGILPSALHYFMCGLRSWNWHNRLGILQDYITGGLTDG